jgi:hypothetical protein
MAFDWTRVFQIRGFRLGVTSYFHRSIFRYDTIYLLTAIGLPPGRSITVHFYTQTIHTKQTLHRTTQKFWKSAGRAPSLRVIPWHFPYNWGKSCVSVSSQTTEFQSNSCVPRSIFRCTTCAPRLLRINATAVMSNQVQGTLVRYPSAALLSFPSLAWQVSVCVVSVPRLRVPLHVVEGDKD